MTKFNAIFQTDSYKLSHFGQMPPKATELYSHLTPRNNRYLKQKFPLMGDKVVVYGTTGVTKLLVEMWDENFFNLDWEFVKEQALNLLNPFVGIVEEDLEKFKKLHDLQYLPLEIKSLDEGSHVSVNIPVLTVRNTHPDFYWLTNFIEPFLLSNIYKPMSVATLTLELARLRNYWFSTTVEDHSGIDYALHDFSYRGHACTESAAFSLSAYLLYTKGTDTLSAIDFAQRYYNADNTIANSLPAFEHSTASLGIQHYRKALDVTDPVSLYGLPKEFVDKALTACLQVKESLLSKGITSTEEIELAIGETFNLARALLLIYPTGLFAYVVDTYDYQRLLTVVVPALKDIILSRDGKLILRPDCYSNDTEVLTPSGFKFFKDLTQSDLVAQVLSDGTYEYVKPLKIVSEYYKGKMYSFKDYHGKVDQLVTPNHRMIYKQIKANGTTSEVIKFAEDMLTQGNHLNYFERSAKAYNHGRTLTALERLRIAFQADGSFIKGCTTRVRFNFSKNRKVERLRSILDLLGVKYKIYKLAGNKTEFNISIDVNLLSKTFDWVDTSDLCSNWSSEFCEELKHWDSSIRSDTRFKYDTTSKECANVVELIAIAAGKGVYTSVSSDNRKECYADVYTSHIMDSNRVGGQSWVKEEVEYEGTVHCVQVPSGRLLVKRNRSIMVCGNSGNPVKVLCGDDHSDNAHEYCGTIETLWGIFGGHLNIHGYQELDSHIGVVYGDGMNFKNIQLIYMKLASKGFAVSNVCLSGGAYMLSAITRDDLGFAIKGSNAIVDGISTPIYKQPKTDMSKASPKGYLKVTKENEEFVLHSNVSKEEEKEGELKTIFFDGYYVDHPSFETIKQRVAELAKV